MSSDAGTSDQMLKRKFRVAWKELRRDFKHASRNGGRSNGAITAHELRGVLERHDINLTDAQ